MAQNLKQQISQQFSKAAQHYHQYNQLQQHTSQQLCAGGSFQAQLQGNLQGKVLDIGAGTGTAFPQANQVFALDIALGMLAQLQQNFPQYQTIQGCAQQLPFLEHSMDVVYSNLALQWCEDLPRALHEAYRVLKSRGELAVAIVIEQSLPELQQLGFHVNQFPSLAFIEQTLAQQSWQELAVDVQTEQFYFADLKSLLWSVKGVGANTAMPTDTAAQARQVLTKQAWQQKLDQAETLRTEQGLPLSYQICYVRGVKA